MKNCHPELQSTDVPPLLQGLGKHTLQSLPVNPGLQIQMGQIPSPAKKVAPF